MNSYYYMYHSLTNMPICLLQLSSSFNISSQIIKPMTQSNIIHCAAIIEVDSKCLVFMQCLNKFEFLIRTRMKLILENNRIVKRKISVFLCKNAGISNSSDELVVYGQKRIPLSWLNWLFCKLIMLHNWGVPTMKEPFWKCISFAW